MRNKKSSRWLASFTSRLHSRNHQHEGNQYFTCRPSTGRPTRRCCNAQESHGTNEDCVIHLDKTHGTDTKVPFISNFPFRAYSQSLTLSVSASDDVSSSLDPFTRYQEVDHSVSPCEELCLLCTPQTQGQDIQQAKDEAQQQARKMSPMRRVSRLELQ
ncbi:uncharacterized protein LY89DRAFT_77635 [Mollisia scopiformis]|uniref:Uncharacterized protein n=1 Tax=Mollisia scopiformis TaxID=149040 RepID=A0A194X7Y3_MOLSC|nr:uncharacterized protein LY89DRAFT_77635 [Mollisia scopiformis]KUJ16219.1 hypothetical protein LY89DRAFT_77635 [Mollisia scopiformis]